LQGNINKMASAQNDKQAAEQLAAFNSGYEAYNKQYLKGTDIITVVNKAVEDNSKYGYGIAVKVTLKVNYNNGNNVSISRNTRLEYIAEFYKKRRLFIKWFYTVSKSNI